MTTTPSTLNRFRRDARRLAKRIVRKLTHKADLSIAVTVNLPPFVKVAVTYKRVAQGDRPAPGASPPIREAGS